MYPSPDPNSLLTAMVISPGPQLPRPWWSTLTRAVLRNNIGKEDTHLQSKMCRSAEAQTSKRTAPQWQPPVCFTRPWYSLEGTEIREIRIPKQSGRSGKRATRWKWSLHGTTGTRFCFWGGVLSFIKGFSAFFVYELFFFHFFFVKLQNKLFPMYGKERTGVKILNQAPEHFYLSGQY